ncbi:MAG: hypothetical protein JWN58_1494 [Gammaproteobacteria bacterium]|nr:hypothetical protein [Gammaproteobacteria bacterium]
MKKTLLLVSLLALAGSTTAQASARDESAAVQCWAVIQFPGFLHAVQQWFYRPCVGAD